MVTKPKMNAVMNEDRPHNDEMKTMTAIAPTYQKHDFISDFPSALEPTVNHNGCNMVNLLPCCPAVSRISGFSSVQKAESKDWKTIHQPLWEILIKWETVLLQENNIVYKDMKGSVSITQTCPEESLISGFPSLKEPSVINIDLTSMVSLSSSCSKVSQIPGSPSLHSSKEWTISKKQFQYYRPNVVSLLPLCPLISTVQGFSSVKGHKNEGWASDLCSLMYRPHKIIEPSIDFSPDYIDQQKYMFLLAPSCPTASIIPGYPSVAQYKMLSLVPLCPRICSFPGFSSFERASKFQWLFDHLPLYDIRSKKTVLQSQIKKREILKKILALASSCPKASRISGVSTSPQPKSMMEPNMMHFVPCCSSASCIKGLASLTAVPCTEWLRETKPFLKKSQTSQELIMSPTGQEQLHYCNRRDTLKLVISCPKETKVYGFPSAQIETKPLDMVNLYSPAPKAKLNTTEEVTILIQMPSSTEKYALQELPHTQLNIKENSSPSKENAYGETFTMS